MGYNENSFEEHNFVLNKNGNNMMASINEHIFRVTGHLWGESTGHRRVPLTKDCYAELWCVLWSTAEQTLEQIFGTQVIWDANARHCNDFTTLQKSEAIFHPYVCDVIGTNCTEQTGWNLNNFCQFSWLYILTK